jgi:hypothetical protein
MTTLSQKLKSNSTINLLIGLAIIIVSIFLLRFWLSQGLVHYSKVVPYYDSLDYQAVASGLLYEAKNRPFDEALSIALSNGEFRAFLYKIHIVIFGSLLANNDTVHAITLLYLYLLPIHLLAILSSGYCTYKLTRSRLLSLISPLVYLSAGMMGQAKGGILDQRMDLASTSWLVIVWAFAILWAHKPKWTQALLLGIVIGLSVLHRPINLPMLLPGLLFIALYINYREQRNVRLLTQHLVFIGVVSGLIISIIVIPHLNGLFQYYTVYNIDVGVASFGIIINKIQNAIIRILPVSALVLPLILALVSSVLLRIVSRQRTILICGLFISPLIILIIARTQNGNAYRTIFAALPFIPLIFKTNSESLKNAQVIAAILALILFSGSVLNLNNLNTINLETPPDHRHALVNFLREFNLNIPEETPTIWVEGSTLGFPPMATIAIGILNQRIVMNIDELLISHIKLGLPAENALPYEITLDLSRDIVDCHLNIVFDTSEYLLLVDPLSTDPISSDSIIITGFYFDEESPYIQIFSERILSYPEQFTRTEFVGSILDAQAAIYRVNKDAPPIETNTDVCP